MSRSIAAPKSSNARDDLLQPKFVAAAAVAAIPVLWLGFKAYRRLFRSSTPLVESECTKWTAQEVAQWLSANKFSPACIKAFVANDVDGDTLLRLQSSHLADMGVTKVKDRILFERLVQPLRAAATLLPVTATAGSDAENSEAEGDAQDGEEAAQRALVRNDAVQKEPEAEEMRKIMMMLMQQLQAIYRVCSSDAFLHGQPDTQRKTIAISKEKLREVQQVAAMLPSSHQGAVAPLITSLTQLIEKVEEGLEATTAPAPPPRQANASAAVMDERTKASLVKLQQMLAGFTESICSDEAASLPLEEKRRLTESITSQVSKIMQALTSLPPEVAEPITAQCRDVLRLSSELLNRPAAGHGHARGQRLGQPPAAAEAAPVQRASLEFLVSRLRAVFEALRSPKTLELAPEPRLQLIEKMEEDVTSVANEVDHLPASDKQILVQVLENVVSVLQQIKMITAEEQKMAKLKAAGAQTTSPSKTKPVEDENNEESEGLSVEKVSDAIRSVLAMIKSEKFAQVPPEAQRQVAARMLQQLQGLDAAVKGMMGPAEQQHLLPMIAKVGQLVSMVASQAGKSATTAATTAATGNDEEEDEKPEVNEDFLKIVATLKQVFEMVNSKQFQSAPGSTRQNISKELLQHVRSVEETSKQLSPAQRKAVQEMSAPLIRLLTAVASMPPSRQVPPTVSQSQQADDETVEEDDSEEGGQSGAFSAIISSLQEVFEVVNSDSFKNAPLSAQQDVARQLNDHVRTLSTHLSKLSKEEKATALRFVEPLQSLLETILSQGSDQRAAPQSTGTQATEEDDEEADSEAMTGAKATYDVISKLQKLYAVAQSDNFINAPPPQQQRIATMIRGELAKLERDTTALPGEQRMQVIPLIRQLGQLLNNFASDSFVEEVEGQEGGKAEEADDDDEERPRLVNEQDLEERTALFERAVDAVMTMRQRVISFEELQEMLQLLDELDVAGISSQQEITIRQALHQAIKQSIQKIQKQHGLEEDQEDEEEANGEEAEAAPETGSNGDVFNLTRFFQSLLQLLRSAELKNTRQLIPFTERIEATLNDADEQGIPWRRDRSAFQAVTEVLTEVQAIQQRLQSSGPSEIEQLLRSAAADVLKDKPTSIEHLGPYLELLEQVAKMQDQMTIEDLEAYQELQKAVILVRDGILRTNKSPSSSQQNSPLSRSKTTDDKSTLSPGSLKSPMFTTAAPPNTPAAVIRDDPSLDEEEDEQYNEEEDEEIENGDDDEEPTQEDAMIGEMLFQIYQKLQRQRHTNEELAPFERVIQQLRTKTVNPRVTQILDAVEELVEKHRAVNDDDTSKELADERKKAEALLRQENNRSSPGSADKAKAASPQKEQEQNMDESAMLNDDEAADAASEGIVDGLSNQLALLPRILERLQLADFMQNTTLFEIQCIGRILVHLGEARTVTRNEGLRQAVERARQLFGEHMQSFRGNVKDGSAFTCDMRLTGMAMELDKGEHLTQYTLIGAEEEEYTINEQFVAKLDGNALEVGQPASEVVEQWRTSSRCIIFSIQQYPEGQENATSLSELTMLVDVLDAHEFDVTSVPAEGITAQDAADVIKSVLSERPTRLMVYYHTPYPDSIAPEMHAVTFADGTTLPHREVVAMCKGLVERVVIVHDQTRRLEVAAARDGVMSSYVSVALTEGAAQIANTSRCWLFDGVFTPAVVESISLHSSGFLCPEELITGTLAQLTGKTISQGSFSDEPAMKMAFFATA